MQNVVLIKMKEERETEIERGGERKRERESALPYRRLGGTRDGVIVIMERACARSDETYTRTCNVTACIRSFTCNHGGASRRRRELCAVLIVAPVMSKAKPILFALDSRQRADWRQTRSRNKTSLFPSKWHNEWRVSQWRCHSSRFAQRNIFFFNINMEQLCLYLARMPLRVIIVKEMYRCFLYSHKVKYRELLINSPVVPIILMFSIAIMCVNLS